MNSLMEKYLECFVFNYFLLKFEYCKEIFRSMEDTSNKKLILFLLHSFIKLFSA